MSNFRFLLHTTRSGQDHVRGLRGGSNGSDYKLNREKFQRYCHCIKKLMDNAFFHMSARNVADNFRFLLKVCRIARPLLNVKRKKNRSAYPSCHGLKRTQCGIKNAVPFAFLLSPLTCSSITPRQVIYLIHIHLYPIAHLRAFREESRCPFC